MLEIIPPSDVVNKYTKRGVYVRKGRNLPKRRFNTDVETLYSNRKRKRCFKCGHYQGQWCEVFEHGKWRYHFLCSDCKDNIAD